MDMVYCTHCGYLGEVDDNVIACPECKEIGFLVAGGEDYAHKRTDRPQSL